MTKKKATASASKKPRIRPAALAAFVRHGSCPSAPPKPGPGQSGATQAMCDEYYDCACKWGRC
ncbi:MAG: hypothetical protein ACYDH9_17910 [Limisphaerales bacterium]